MKLYHITKQGNLHFELADGRYAAVYPGTGYVRVSMEWRVHVKWKKLSSSDRSMAERGAPGNILMYQLTSASLKLLNAPLPATCITQATTVKCTSTPTRYFTR